MCVHTCGYGCVYVHVYGCLRVCGRVCVCVREVCGCWTYVCMGVHGRVYRLGARIREGCIRVCGCVCVCMYVCGVVCTYVESCVRRCV